MNKLKGKRKKIGGVTVRYMTEPARWETLDGRFAVAVLQRPTGSFEKGPKVAFAVRKDRYVTLADAVIAARESGLIARLCGVTE